MIPKVFKELTQADELTKQYFFNEHFLKDNIEGETEKEFLGNQRAFLEKRALRQVYALLRLIGFIIQKEVKKENQAHVETV